ncbi:SCO2400 family protein [Streptomyces cynarae]|uniref:SCO2400 family protein n=1 Tax=Streptomyces cynarae TaxID=2981134 RepID=UPI00406CE974
MDYCSSCRRHLNGALVCPGCGAYAPDIAPVTADGHTVPGAATTATPVMEATAATAAWEFAAPDIDEGPHIDEAPHAGPPADLTGPTRRTEGRAARRRRLARWKKTQRKALVATAVALVGGGLTVASMDRHTADRAQAAPAPEASALGGAEEPTSLYSSPAPPRSGTPSSGAHRASHAPTAQSPAADPARLSSPVSAHATPSAAQPDTATSRTTHTTGTTGAAGTGTSGTGHTTANSPSQSGTDSSSSSSSTGTSQHSSSPTTGTGGGTDPGTSQTTPSPAATSPSQVCLLVICLG